ncbi:hypothetical protein [Tabrizicola thermarum]|nr:hypothetical protein [Tabrizicola thermarum]
MSTETQTPNRLYFAVWRWHFPMLGLTLLAVIVLDLVILSAVPPLKRLVS